QRWLVAQNGGAVAPRTGLPDDAPGLPPPLAPPHKGEGDPEGCPPSSPPPCGEGVGVTRQTPSSESMAALIVVEGGAKPDISILDSEERVPWAGHSARYATPEIYDAIKRHKTTLLFVNTRSQAELLFRELWRV